MIVMMMIMMLIMMAAAAAAAATIGEMHLKEKRRKRILEMWLFFEICNFQKFSQTMLISIARFLRTTSMRKRLNLNFLGKIGWYIPFFS